MNLEWNAEVHLRKQIPNLSTGHSILLFHSEHKEKFELEKGASQTLQIF